MSNQKDSKPRNEYITELVDVVKAVWNDPIGKLLLITGGLVITTVAMGGAFRLLAFTTHGYKDFMKAARR